MNFLLGRPGEPNTTRGKHMHTGFADKLEPFRVVMHHPQQVSETTATNTRGSYHATPLLCYAMQCKQQGISGMGYVTDDLNTSTAAAREHKGLFTGHVHELIVPYRCTSSKPPDKNTRFDTK